MNYSRYEIVRRMACVHQPTYVTDVPVPLRDVLSQMAEDVMYVLTGSPAHWIRKYALLAFLSYLHICTYFEF